MPNFQQTIILGHLGRDVELRTTATGKSVANFSVAVSEKRGDEKFTEWFSCTAWENTADLIARSFKKGDAAGFIGKLRTREYEKDGQKRKATDLIVDRVVFVGGGRRADTVKDVQETFSGNEEAPF